MTIQMLPLPVQSMPTPVPKELLLIMDCSGSMYGPLHTVRSHLSTELIKALAPQDQLSVIWFSGHNECGTILRHETVATLADTVRVSELITRWLQPIGMTNFQGALQLAHDVIRTAGRPVFVQFMSDGMDNQSNREEVLAIAQAIGQEVSGAEVIEYGEYADRTLLDELAAKLGGRRIHLHEPEEYSQHVLNTVEAATTPPRTAVDAPGAQYLAVCTAHGEWISVDLDAVGRAWIPANSQQAVAFQGLPDAAPTGEVRGLEGDMLYLHLAQAAGRLDSAEVDRTLRALGDRELSLISATLYGKQRYSAFEALVRHKLSEPSERYAQGFDPNAVPSVNAVTLTDVLATLEDGKSLLLMGHSAFTPKRISKKQHARSLDEEREALVKRCQGDPEKLSAGIEGLLHRAQAQARFIPASRSAEGMPITDLISHKERANLSIRVKMPGTLKLSAAPEGVETEIETHTYRTFTLLFGGVVNLPLLPIIPSPDALESLKALGVIDAATAPGEAVVLDLLAYPVTSRARVQQVSALDLARINAKMMIQQAIIKAMNEVAEQVLPPRTQVNLINRYGEDNARWLRDIGLTDHGFSAPSVSEESSDTVRVAELVCNLKGLSSLPKVSEVRQRQKAGTRLTLGGELISKGLQKLQDFRQVHQGKTEGQMMAALKNFLEIEVGKAQQELRELSKRRENIRFAVLLGGAWFADLPESGEVSFNEQGHAFTAAIRLREVELSL